MSEVFKYNTEESVQQSTGQQPTLALVAENNPILKEIMPEFDFKNPPVNPMALATVLVETCKLHKGYGLSANQCGFKHRVFVMGAEDSFVAFFNPKIIWNSDDESNMMEGCLSFPLLGLRINRPSTIEVEYQDFNGQTHTTMLNGLSARVFQHELDHLNGIVYTERVKPMALQSGMKKRNKVMKMVKKINGNSN